MGFSQLPVKLPGSQRLLPLRVLTNSLIFSVLYLSNSGCEVHGTDIWVCLYVADIGRFGHRHSTRELVASRLWQTSLDSRPSDRLPLH